MAQGNSDHSILSAVISVAQAVPDLCVNRKVFLKQQENWNTVCGAKQDLPSRNIWSADNHVEDLNEHCPCWLDIMYQPLCTMFICVHNKDKPWFVDHCRRVFGLKQETHIRWTREYSRVNWKEFVHCQKRAILKHNYR